MPLGYGWHENIFREGRITYVFNQQASTRPLLIWVHDDYVSMTTQNLSFEK